MSDEIITQEPEVKKRRGRRPMTEEEKRIAAEARAASKEKAANMTPEVLVQFQDTEVSVESLIESAKVNFKSIKKRTRITSLKLYIKPEERTAYYVINDAFDGKVEY